MHKLRIGVIGVSGRAGRLTGHWHDPCGRSVLAGGTDLSEDALNAFREKFGPDLFVTKNADELISHPEIDALAIMTPDSSHEEYAVKAFESGKHVFCEKPMAITTEGCDRMLRAWRASGCEFMVGFNMRYMNIFRTIKDIVDSGVIGDIKAVWCRHFVGHGGAWYYHDWHASSRNTNGLLLQKASHDIDMIHWITGQYAKSVCGFGSLDYYGGDKPDSLTCQECEDKNTCPEFKKPEKRGVNRKNLCAFRSEVDVEDSSTIMMQLNGGIKATYMQCHYTPDYWRNYVFIGTRGRVENMDDSSRVVVKLRENASDWENLADRVYEVKPSPGGHFGADPRICRDFVDMILEDKEPVSTPVAGRMSVAAACAGTLSIRENSRVVVVPDLPEALA